MILMKYHALFFIIEKGAKFEIVVCCKFSDIIWDFRKLPLPSHLGTYFIKIGKIRAIILEIGENKGHFWIGNDSRIRL